MASKVQWATPQCGGGEWVVCIAPRSADPELEVEGTEGLCKPSLRQTFVCSDAVPPSAYRQVRFHEDFHMVGFISGAKYALQKYLGLDDDKIEELEEFLNVTYGQALFDFLERNRYLSYEPLPTIDEEES